MKITISAWSDSFRVDAKIVVQVPDGEWWQNAVEDELSRVVGVQSAGCYPYKEEMRGDCVESSYSVSFYEHGRLLGVVLFSALMKFVEPK